LFNQRIEHTPGGLNFILSRFAFTSWHTSSLARIGQTVKGEAISN
jgi:hypothetical protein